MARRIPLGGLLLLRRRILPLSSFSTDASPTGASTASSSSFQAPPQPAAGKYQGREHLGTATVSPEAPPRGTSRDEEATVEREAVRQKKSSRERGGGDYEEEQSRVLRAALGHVVGVLMIYLPGIRAFPAEGFSLI